jgi:hypothetical protein
MWRTVWAEDGTRFYADALARPWRANVLESYAGYAHVIPRTLASIGVHLPTGWYSAYVTLAASFVAALLALFVYFASAPLLRSPVRQAILAVALLLWPVLPFEITGTITNIQWGLPVACLLAVLLPVERPWALAIRIPLVVLAPLSSPLCVLFVPIALWHCVRYFTRHTSARRLIIPVIYGLASAIQLAVFLTAPQNSGTRPSLTTVAPDIAKLYSTKVVTEFAFGVRVTEDVWDSFGYRATAVVVVLLVAALAWRFWRATATSRWFIGACLAASVAIYFVSVFQRSEFISDMFVTEGSRFNFGGMRYELFPAALLLLALLVPLDLERGAVTEPSAPPPRRLVDDVRDHRWVLAIAAVWMCVAFVPSYQLDTGRSPGPDWVTGVEGAESSCAVDPTGAGAVAVPISPQPIWFVAVPCWELERHG